MPPTTVTNGGPAANEFSVKLTKPFDGLAQHIVEVYGEGANKPASVRITNYEGGKERTSTEKVGDVPSDDVRELSELMESLRGFPSHPDQDVYGHGVRLEYNALDIQWSNKAQDDAGDVVNEIAGEQKDDFKRVADSVDALARQFAKRNAEI